MFTCYSNLLLTGQNRMQVNNTLMSAACQYPPVFVYRKPSNISRTLAGNEIVDNSDVVGASPVGAAPTTSSFPT